MKPQYRKGKIVYCFSATFLLMFLFLVLAESSSADMYTTDMFQRRARIDNKDFLTKDDFLINADLPLKRGLKMWEFLVHPVIRATYEYDSNIYLTSRNEISDYIWMLNPGLGIVLPVQDHTFGISYNLEDYTFQDNPENDHTDQYWAGLAEFVLTDYTFTLRDMYGDFSSRTGSEDTNRISQVNNEFMADVLADYDKLQVELGYRNKNIDYQTDEFIVLNELSYEDKDNTQDIGEIQISYLIKPKTSALFDLEFGKIDYDSLKSSDSDYMVYLLGLRGDLRKNLTLHVKAGYRDQTYDTSTYTISKDFSSPVIRSGLEYQFRERDIFNLNVFRDVYESTYRDSNWYDVNFLGITYLHIFSEKLGGRIFASWQENTYPEYTSEIQHNGTTETAKREDEFYNIGVGLKYYIRDWLSTDAKYEYRERTSNFDIYGYEEELISLRVVAGF